MPDTSTEARGGAGAGARRSPPRRLLAPSRFRFLACAMPALFLLATAPALAAARPVIREHRFVYRDQRTGSETPLDMASARGVAAKVRLPVGSPYSQQAADAELRRLNRALGLVCIEIRPEPVPGGVRVVFVFEKSEKVWAVRVVARKDAPPVDADELRQVVHLRRDQPLSLEAIDADRRRIVEHLRKDGYHFATVDARAVPVPALPGFRVVRFVVDRGPKVQPTKILITGNHSIETRRILAVMRTKEDRWYTSRRFREADYREDLERIRLLYLAGGWEDVRVQARPVLFDPEPVTVTVETRPENGRPVVTRIEVHGAKAVPARLVRRMFLTKPGRVFSRDRFRRDIQWLKDRYYRSGFRVDPRDESLLHRATEDGGKRFTATLLFGRARETVVLDFALRREVRAGRAVLVVDRVTCKTTGPYPNARVAGLLGLRPGAPYTAEAMFRDVAAVARFYARPAPAGNHALLRVRYEEKAGGGHRVRMDFVKKGPRGRRVAAFLRIDVREGPRYFVESITFDGVPPVFEQHLRDRVRLRKGSPFSRLDLERDIKTIRAVYAEQGYPEAKVTHTERVGDHVYHLRYKVEPGPLYHIGLIRPRGNDRTRRSVIVREMPIQSGDRYDVRKIEEGIRALERKRYFKKVQWWAVDSRRVEPGKRFKDIYIRVQEVSTRRLILGAGAGSNSGFFGILGFQDTNFDMTDSPRSWNDFVSGSAFTGGGQTVQLLLQPGSERSTFALRFYEPWLNERRVGLGLGAGFDSVDWDTYTVDRLGGSVSVDKRYPLSGSTLSLGVRLHRADVTDVDFTAPPDVWDDEGTHFVLGISGGLSRDNIEKSVFPTRGRKFSLRAELIGTPVFEALKLSAGGRMYRPLGGRAEAAMAVWGDAAILLGGDLPVFERLYAGGFGSVRGFAYRGISPRNKVVYVNPANPGLGTVPVTGDGDPIGGKLKVQGGVEYHFPIVRDQVRGIVFLDAGSVAEDSFDVGRLLGDLRISAGVGAEFVLPFLGKVPVAVFVGFPIKSESGDETEAFSFSLGFLLQ